MELQQLLNLKNPTLKQLEETEALLQGMLEKNQNDLVALDAEGLATAATRLCGGECGEDREAARNRLVSASNDAAHVLTGVQAKIAIERARQADEIEAEAWGKTWEHLAKRREAFREIEKLLDRIGTLYGTMSDAYRDAIATAPKKADTRAWVCPGHFDVPKAIAVALNTRLGYPLPVGNDSALETELRVNGMPAYLTATENRIMRAPVLNPDGGPIPVSATDDGGIARAA